MRLLPPPDLGDRRHGDARLEAAAHRLVLGGVSDGSNGIAALQLQAQLGWGSYKSAWRRAAKPRRAMVASGRALLAALVEVDATTIPLRRKDDPPEGGYGRSHRGKMLVAAGVEVHDGGPGRVRLGAIPDASAESLHAFVRANVEAGTTARTRGRRAEAPA